MPQGFFVDIWKVTWQSVRKWNLPGLQWCRESLAAACPPYLASYPKSTGLQLHGSFEKQRYSFLQSLEKVTAGISHMTQSSESDSSAIIHQAPKGLQLSVCGSLPKLHPEPRQLCQPRPPSAAFSSPVSSGSHRSHQTPVSRAGRRAGSTYSHCCGLCCILSCFRLLIEKMIINRSPVTHNMHLLLWQI